MRRAAEEILEGIEAAPDERVPTLRRVRRRASRRVASFSASEVYALARLLLDSGDVPRWLVYELVHHHETALAGLDADRLAGLGRGMTGWGEVDPFACYLSGVAWREGAISDDVIHGWAGADDRWWRRAAVVSTVPLNVRARGGSGDPDRTTAVCDLVKDDRDDMVVKAVSWALRALAVREPSVVEDYLETRGGELAARVRREVRNKLETGRKDPGRSRGSAPRKGQE